MVKKTNNVRKEQFDLLKDEIAFWDAEIERSKEILKHSRLVRNKRVRDLLKLQNKYSDRKAFIARLSNNN